MSALTISGFVLFVVGLAGAVNACLAGPNDSDLPPPQDEARLGAAQRPRVIE